MSAFRLRGLLARPSNSYARLGSSKTLVSFGGSTERFSSLTFFVIFDLGYDLIQARNSGADVASSVSCAVTGPISSLIFLLLGKAACVVCIKQFP
jgi:hypothetical protein